MPKPSSSNRAQKRVLWEVRQKYNIQPNSNVAHVKTAPAPKTPKPPSRPPVTPSRKNAPGKKKGKWFKRIAIFLILVTVLTGGVFGYKILAAGNKISTAERSILGQLSDLLFGRGNTLAGEEEGRINILLMAIGGEGHKGQNLADTIMVASLRPETGQVALLSIPRDLYVQVPGEDYFSKINSVHAYGEAQKKDNGPKVMQQVAEEITGLPIHYYGRVDFIAFKEIINAVGGVNITIDNSFFDYWHKIDFHSGTEQMDGERALAYVRARYIEGPEGGDFKRAARQQQILLALREKIFSVNTALDFAALNEILGSVSDNVRTNLQLWEMKRLYELARQVNQEQVYSSVYTTGPKGVLVGTTEILGGTPASVLKTRSGDYSETQALAAGVFSEGEKISGSDGTPVPTKAPTPSPQPEEDEAPATKPTLEIRNGTSTTGLAKGASDDFTDKGYEVLIIGNAATVEEDKTIVYVIDEKLQNGAQEVADDLKAELKTGLPDTEEKTDAEVLVILGDDAS